MKMQNVSAAVAIAAVVAVGVSGVAGAATPVHGHHDEGGRARLATLVTTGSLPASFSCATADKALGAVIGREGIVATRLRHGEAAEHRARATASTVRAERITARLAAGERMKTNLLAVESLITTRCPAATASSTSSRSTAARVERRGALLAELHHLAATKTLPASFSCSTASSATSRISSLESRLSARIAAGSKAEQAASSAGNTVRATSIAHRVSVGERIESELQTVSGVISAHCGS